MPDTDFFFTFCNVRLQLSSACYFLAEFGMVTFHTSNPSYKGERDVYMVLGLVFFGTIVIGN